MPAERVKILIIRNDKIGDFMLAWPAFALLKKQYPDAEVTALVPQYTAPLAKQCEWIDKVLIDNKKDSLFDDILSLSKNIKRNNYDFSISLFSELRTSLSLWLAGVTNRIGPATKIAQVFLNRTLKQKRSQSRKPEYEYNLDLAKYFIEVMGDTPSASIQPPFLSFDKLELQNIKDKLLQKHGITKGTPVIFIHPGTGGSAINLSNEQYANLAINILEKKNVYFIITSGPGELPIANDLSARIQESSHHIHSSDEGIIEFCKFIAICDLFVSGSTGPLHIAGALNVNTAAFYPARKSATALRWQTLNSKERRLSFSPEEYTGDNDMMQIDPKTSANEIVKYFLT